MARTELTGKQIKNQSVDLTLDIAGVLPVVNGGTGSDTLATNAVLLGNGTGALQAVSPGTSGYVLTSNGSTWVAAAPTGGGGAGDVTTNTTSSVDSELVLFSGTTGKELKRATGTGWAYVTAGVLSVESTIAQSAVTNLTTDLAAKQDTADKGQPDGYASLDAEGLVPLTQLPITTADWTTLEGKPAVVAAGATEADARAAIHAEYTGNKGQPGGYAELDEVGVVPIPQLPPGVVIDGVAVGSESFQLLSGSTPIGSPISILLGNVDGGSPTVVTAVHVDGGELA